MIQDIAPHRYDPAYRTPKVKESDKVLIYREMGCYAIWKKMR